MEIRAIDNLSVANNKIVGRPVVYNSRSENLGGFVEIIAPNAFSESLDNDIRALVEHEPTLLLGRTSSGTMTIREDNQGLLVEIDPPATTRAQDLLVSIERGDIKGMSFGFSVPAGGDSWDYNANPAVRTVNKGILSEITVTALPAYKATDVTIAKRSLQHNNPNHSLISWLDIEELI